MTSGQAATDGLAALRWQEDTLLNFQALCAEYFQLDQRLASDDEQGQDVLGAIATDAPTVRKILIALGDEPEPFDLATVAGVRAAGLAAHGGIGVIRNAEAVARHLGPVGPSLGAEQLHPWVWQAVASFWDAGQHAVAVDQAAKSLVAHTQSKSGSALPDRTLMGDVLSSDQPRDGKTRLWFPGDRDSNTWKSRQQGLHLMAQGAYAGIRNIVAHTLETDWTEQEALEYLAVLSVLARWIEETEVATGPR